MEDVNAATGQDVALETGQEGIEAAEVTGVTEVQAEGERLDTPSEEEAPESGQEAEKAEGAEEGEQPKKSDKKTFEQRIAEMEAKLEEKFAARLQQQAAEQPNFAPPEKVATVKQEIAAAVVRARQIEAELELMEPQELAANYQLAEEALELRERIQNARTWVRQNEAEHVKYQERMQAQQQNEQQAQHLNAVIGQAAELVAKEHNIPADLWKKGEEFFQAERAAKPLLDAQYREKVYTQGPVAALLWAKEYVEKNMGAGAKADQEAKNEAKQKLPATTGTVTVAGKEIKTWEQLMALSGSEINKFYRENPKLYKRLNDSR